MWECSICRGYHGTNLRSLLHHISCVHRFSVVFACYCPVTQCFRKFQKYDTLYKHVKKDHAEVYNEVTPADVLVVHSKPNQNFGSSSHDCDVNNVATPNDLTDSDNDDDNNDADCCNNDTAAVPNNGDQNDQQVDQEHQVAS